MSAAMIQARAYLQAAWAAAGKVVYRAGAILPDSGEWQVHEANTRAALTEFWKVKATAYPHATGADPAEWLSMDAEAHRVWAQLEQQLQYTDAPENVKAHGDQAKTALERATALSVQAGNLRLAERTHKQALEATAITANATRNAIDTSYSHALAQQTGNILTGNLLGIPTWAWILGGGLVVLALVRR